YARAEQGQCSREDEQYIDEAIKLAKERRPELDQGLLDFLRSILLLKKKGEIESEFVMQFQQFTGPAMAKGVEDTAFYNFNRLVSLNEVGGDPGRFGVTVEEFHGWCERIQRDWPRTMLATSTHDTKRSEDVRARIALLSSMPEMWEKTVRRWSARNEPLKTEGLPDRNTEYLLYQTLVGAWPISLERLQAYMLKAMREAKRQTSWTAPNMKFEKALETFVAAILHDDEFAAEARSFIEPLIAPARIISLAQLLLKLTAPGIPDIYQGTEIWDLSLVDPDNRRAVDYQVRRDMLRDIQGINVEEVLRREDEGLPKLWVLTKALSLRSRLGNYSPLPLTGSRKDEALAFSRGEVVTVVPRMVMGTSDWGDTAVEVPAGRNWQNVLTGEDIGSGNIQLARLFQRFPVALLAAESPA
ncbi:MAG TPA: malto-oligosyltrehalose synthase, partial [Bryobacteraceae bacterium]